VIVGLEQEKYSTDMVDSLLVYNRILCKNFTVQIIRTIRDKIICFSMAA